MCRPLKYRYDGRGSARERGYDWQWKQVRGLYLRQHPLCEDCEEEGRIVLAEMVHHIVSVVNAPELRLVFSNLRSLCWVCHGKYEESPSDFF